ncbi:MAG: adenosylcobinamide-GDP ribazoletransferase, partial [Victivallaceae bacterium]
HDSRIGTMGVLAMFGVLGIKATAFYSMMPEQLVPVVFLAAVSGRCAIVFYVNISRYARPSGLGEIMFRRKSILSCIWALGVMFGLCGWMLGYRGLVAAAAVMIFCISWRIYCRHKIGGATGDTIGACEEIAEMLIPLVVCIGA